MSDLVEPIQPQFVISENWLTRKPDPNSILVVLFSVLIVVLGSYLYWENLFNLATLMPANAHAVFTDHQFWRAWTALLVHADLTHLFSNLFLFIIFGYFLTGYFGTLFFPVVAFTFGGFTNLIVLSKMPSFINLIGLSGVVFWMGGAWLILYFLIESRKTAWQKALRTLGVGLVLFMPSEAFDPSTSYFAHFVGFLGGLLSGLTYFRLNRNLIRSAEVYQITDAQE